MYELDVVYEFKIILIDMVSARMIRNGQRRMRMNRTKRARDKHEKKKTEKKTAVDLPRVDIGKKQKIFFEPRMTSLYALFGLPS